jgi:hypothetical protein
MPFASAKPPSYIIIRALVCGIVKYLRSFVVFYYLPKQKESGFIADAPCLLHIVRHDYYGVVLLQLAD